MSNDLMIEIRYREIKLGQSGQIIWKTERFSPIPDLMSNVVNLFEIGRLYEIQCRVIFPASPDQNQEWSEPARFMRAL